MNLDMAKLDKSGRLLIPAKIRRDLGILEGDSLFLRLDKEGLHISTQAQALARAQALVRRLVPGGRSLVDELITDRREEVREEP